MQTEVGRQCECGTEPVGIEVRSEYDGVLFWQCDTCRHGWNRWAAGSIRWFRAQKYLDILNRGPA